MSYGSFPLVVQNLPTIGDRVLVLGQLAALRQGAKRFSVGSIREINGAFRLPALGNVNPPLSRLAKDGLVVRSSGPEPWAVTPLGDEKVRSLIGTLPVRAIEAELADAPGAIFGSTTHRVIPPTMAPPRWAAGIARLLKDHPFETNVFCMTRFPDPAKAPVDPVAPLIPQLREVMATHGLTLHLASDRQLEDDLLANVGAHMWACQYGIGLLEDRAGKGLNYNVVIELGAMIATGRRCALLKDSTSPSLPTDLVGQIYKSVDVSEPDTVVSAVEGWIKDDLGL